MRLLPIEWEMSYGEGVRPDPDKPPTIPNNQPSVDLECEGTVIGYITNFTVQDHLLCATALVKGEHLREVVTMLKGRMDIRAVFDGHKVYRKGGVEYASGGHVSKVMLRSTVKGC